MESSNDTEDLVMFEEMFKDRFTESDAAYMELKSKSLPPPTVIHPWKTMKKQWHKRWDYSAGRRQEDKDSSRNDDYRHQRYSRDKYRDRSPGGCSSYRDRKSDYTSSRNMNWDKEKRRENYRN